MENGEYRIRNPRTKRRSRCLAVALCAFLGLVVVIALSLALTLSNGADDFKSTFIARCESFPGKSESHDCEEIWAVFEQAYVGRDPCSIPMEAYDTLIAETPFGKECNRMFWSKTDDVVHNFTNKTNCFVTIEDTLIGWVLNGGTWCGKEGSRETFTKSDCPTWDQCVNNPVRSFWRRASAVFAETACGDVKAMLSGSIDTPYNPSSVFGSIEVKKFNSTTIKSLTVVLVTQDTAGTKCTTNASLKDLEKELDLKGIKYYCKEVTESKIRACRPDPLVCGSCW